MPRMSSSHLLRLAVLLLALLALPRAANAAASKNLLANPGFEEPLDGHSWMPTAWDTSMSGLPTAFFGRDTFVVHSGQYAANVANISTFLPMSHNWSQSLVVGREAWGKDLLFTVWTRSNGVTGRAYCLLQAYRDTISKMSLQWRVPREEAATRLGLSKVDDPLLDFGWKRLVFDEPETDWVKRELRVHCPPGTNMVFVRCGVMGTGQLLIDDASLTLEPAKPALAVRPGQNLLQDPGFEDPLGAAWEYVVPPYAGLVVQRDTLNAHSGLAGMRLETLTNEDYPRFPVMARSGVCQVVSNRNLGGKRVRLSAWVRTDSLQGVAYIMIYGHGLGGQVRGASSERFSLNTPWRETTQVIDLPPDTYQVWVWCLYDAPVPGQTYFDDVKFEVLGNAPPPEKFKAPKPPKNAR